MDPEAGPVNEGMRCLTHPWIGCGECATCLRGEEHICLKGRPQGVAKPGGFADYVVVPHPRYLIDIAGLDKAEATPLACAGVTTYSAIKKLGDRIHQEPVLILGAGGLGLMAIAVLQAMNAKGAIVVDIDETKRQAALSAGALAAIDAKASDAAKQIITATNGGAGAALDLVGATSTVSLAIQSARRGGHIVICGLMGATLHCLYQPFPCGPCVSRAAMSGPCRSFENWSTWPGAASSSPSP